MRLLKASSLSFLFLLLASCSSTSLSQKKGPPRVADVEALKGQKKEEVLKALGAPSDTQGSRVYYFLSEDSTYHPEPSGKIYELIFVKERLVRVEAR